MTKQKIDFAKYTDMCDATEISGKDGAKITVRNHIPAQEKIALAKEWTEQTVMIHDESCCYRNYDESLWWIYLTAKYYTDIDTDDATPEEVADFLINDGMWDNIVHITQDDFDVVEMIFRRMSDMFMTTYADDVSLAKAVRTSFGFLFNGEDITESLAKAEATKDVVYKAFNALQEKEEEEAKKITDGKATVGGNILNFARKKV